MSELQEVLVVQRAITYFVIFHSLTGMEKSLMDSKPLEYVEPCENYENLPFHGMANPPPKVSYLY